MKPQPQQFIPRTPFENYIVSKFGSLSKFREALGNIAYRTAERYCEHPQEVRVRHARMICEKTGIEMCDLLQIIEQV